MSLVFFCGGGWVLLFSLWKPLCFVCTIHLLFLPFSVLSCFQLALLLFTISCHPILGHFNLL